MKIAVGMDDLNIPERGAAILRVHGNDNDPNWQDVRRRDVPKYLRERHWIRQWSGQRWPRRDFVTASWQRELRLTDLGRRMDDPGDAFFDIGCSSRYFGSWVTVRIWVEVTEVFQPGQAADVNRFVRNYNGLRGKGEIDAGVFLRSLDLDLPGPDLQRAMADHVLAAVIAKARKGREDGSYRSLVQEYGRGALIVGLPLWFSMLPWAPCDPSHALDDFVTRLLLGLNAIQRSVYNFIRIHQTLETTPAVEAGLAPYPYTLEWLVALIDLHAPKPKRPETYRKRRKKMLDNVCGAD